jgi:membrane protein DedA with SNARE-associated domain
VTTDSMFVVLSHVLGWIVGLYYGYKFGVRTEKRLFEHFLNSLTPQEKKDMLGMVERYGQSLKEKAGE